MPKESTPQIPPKPDFNKPFTIPMEEFRQCRSLTPAELAELGESPLDTPTLSEKVTTTTDEFVKDTFETWDSAKASGIKIKAEAVPPLEQSWSDLEGDIDATKAGEYTLNPETQALDFENAKVFIPDLSSFEGKKLSEVAEYVVKTYGDKYYIPGLEYEQWLYQHENLESLPEGKEFEELKQQLKDRICFFFGSTLRYLDGRWCVPSVPWRSSGWYRNASWLGYDWDSDCRVVLLER